MKVSFLSFGLYRQRNYFAILFTLSLSLFSGSVFSGLFPVINSISAIQLSNGSVQYHFTQSLVEVGSATDRILPAGTYNTFIGAKGYSGSIAIIAHVSGSASSGVDITVGDEGRSAYNAYSSITSATLTSIKPSDQCIAYISTPKGETDWNSSVINPAGCTYIPPPTQMCKITSPEILLDHGTITLQDAKGHVAKTSMGVSCTSAMAVTFHLTTNQPYINLSPSGQSEIKIEDMPLNSKIDLPSGTKMLSISDMLSGVSTEGVNAGSSVLVMEPY
ncbi:MAG TPA: hypothetical protein VH187_14735 [Scandinavium sp.]|jgi:hypothetical protein|uniref:hypothetical protein n=1 Tax=Scandinavium sp. TaxID=2830653 RepID=UPI002E34F3FB|nr:hypothetical protein [Scandinavium sp.]HEX4502392.1 hypothetical protein [Scandinavium sp.]